MKEGRKKGRKETGRVSSHRFMPSAASLAEA
jgi:hypothetical protein